MSTPRQVLVVGASGGTGRRIVLDALRRGHRVRAWSAKDDELPLAHPRLEHVSGDVRDAARASAAMHGVDAVVSALGSTRGLERTDVCERGTVAIVRAMQRAGVDRIVTITSMGTTRKLGPVHEHLVDPLLLRGIYDDKRAQELRIRESGLRWTLVRPGRLTDRPDRRALRVVLDGPLPGVMVSRAALARFALDQLETEAFVGLAPYVVEPSFVPWHKVLTLGTDGRR
jgi:nucleoside-diphosphate-sugar epimerase